MSTEDLDVALGNPMIRLLGAAYDVFSDEIERRLAARPK